MISDLQALLAAIPPGPISDTSQLESVLAACWDEFGCHEGGMRGEKLHGRMENVTWSPPILEFRIERHGATALGSSRAELQAWGVNVEEGTATCSTVGRRQVEPMQPRLDVRPLVEETVRMILAHQESDRLKWNTDGSVRVLPGKVIPPGSAVKQTLQGRRKRFREALRERLGRRSRARVTTVQLRAALGLARE